MINSGPNAGIFISGAHAMNGLVKPSTLILTQVNEPAAEGGKLLPASQTATLIEHIKAPSHLAIRGRVMEFDSKGKRVSGC